MRRRSAVLNRKGKFVPLGDDQLLEHRIEELAAAYYEKETQGLFSGVVNNESHLGHRASNRETAEEEFRLIEHPESLSNDELREELAILTRELRSLQQSNEKFFKESQLLQETLFSVDLLKQEYLAKMLVLEVEYLRKDRPKDLYKLPVSK